jgi:hypothetical protein
MPGYARPPENYAPNLAFIPAGSVSATNVQNAIQEVDTEKAPLSSPTFTGGVGIGMTPSSEVGLSVGRADSSSEGGQVNFARSIDNAQAWYLDVFGNTTTPSFRIINSTGTGTVTPMTINTSGLVSGGGTSFGPWTSYTPTIGGVTLGNGSATGGYVKIGRTVIFWAQFGVGSTTTFSGNIFIGLPFTANSQYALQATLYTVAGGFFPIWCYASNNAAELFAVNSASTYGTLEYATSTKPTSLTTSSRFYVSGSYEATS